MTRAFAVAVALSALLVCSAVSAAAQNLLTNPGFDSSLDGWRVVGSVVSWDGTMDGTSSPSSGSAEILWQQDQVTGLVPVVSQCVEVVPNMAYRFGGQVFIPNDLTIQGSAFYNILFFPTSGCAGTPPPGASVQTPMVGRAGSWIGTFATANAFGPSALVTAYIAPAAGGTFRSNFDNVELFPAAGNCTATNQVVCLKDRFKVTATFDTGKGLAGNAQGSEIGDSAIFSFFNSGNIELVAKVLDGCAVGGHFWVFAGGLTNVGVTLTVTDTQNSASNSYTNPINTPFQPIQDTTAFDCP